MHALIVPILRFHICPEEVPFQPNHVTEFLIFITLNIVVLVTGIHYYTGLFKVIVGILTTCHTKYTSDSYICIFLFNIPTLPVFVT